MKSLRLPFDKGGEVWVLTHDLALDERKNRKLRPIHAFTFLAQHLAGNKPQEVFWLGLALENKLFAAGLFHFELRSAIAQVGDPVYYRRYVRDYEGEQRVIATLEALLSAIYTCLEISAEINRFLHPGLRIGFREQSKKIDTFSFNRWPWLGHFHDVRSELAHFNTPLPSIIEQNIQITFRRAKKLEHFTPGTHQVSFNDILNYYPELLRMLDVWATEELVRIDPKTEVRISSEPRPNMPLKPARVKVEQILRLLREPKTRKPKGASREKKRGAASTRKYPSTSAGGRHLTPRSSRRRRGTQSIVTCSGSAAASARLSFVR